jgi:ankyrin repeat protein
MIHFEMDPRDYCRTGNLIELRRVIEHNCIIIDEKDRFGQTLLHDAVYYRHLDIVRELIRHGACLNVKSNIGNTPLHVASDYGSLYIVQELLSHDTSMAYTLCTERNNVGKTPLHFASARGDLDIVEALIDYSDLGIKNNRGETALEVAMTKAVREYIANYEPVPSIKEPDKN